MSEEKTVYFLGAGASNASEFRLPVMKEFFKDTELVREKFPQLYRFMERNFPGTPIERVSLEDVITYLDLGLDRFGRLGKQPKGYLYDARVQFNRYVRTRLDYECWTDKYSCGRFEKVFLALGKTDTIVTLNYDLVTENTLNSIQTKKEKHKADHPLYERMYNLIVESPIYDIAVERRYLDSGLYLKLHGSIDWYHCPYQNCRNYSLITVLSKSERVRDVPCMSCGSSLHPIVVPPTMNQAFGDYPGIGAMWTLARRHLGSATRVVFIGVSFAESDYYLRWLIKTSFLEADGNRSVVVVDRYKTPCKRIEGIIGRQPDAYYRSLRSYIACQGQK